MGLKFLVKVLIELGPPTLSMSPLSADLVHRIADVNDIVCLSRRLRRAKDAGEGRANREQAEEDRSDRKCARSQHWQTIRDTANDLEELLVEMKGANDLERQSRLSPLDISHSVPG